MKLPSFKRKEPQPKEPSSTLKRLVETIGAEKAKTVSNDQENDEYLNQIKHVIDHSLSFENNFGNLMAGKRPRK